LQFSASLARAERGKDILITKHNKPVEVLSPYRRLSDDCRTQKGDPTRRAANEKEFALGCYPAKVYPRSNA
jgi:antitoxin (DNA-binding transcriptional repressor) of toxin-antitoxin stability system